MKLQDKARVTSEILPSEGQSQPWWNIWLIQAYFLSQS